MILEAIIGMPILASALFFLGWSIYLVYVGRNVRLWPTTTGKMLESRISKRHNDEGVRLCTVAFLYRYTVNGRTYQANTWRFRRGATSQMPREARDLLQKYPYGSRVTVYYHPRKHKHAVLDPTVQWHFSSMLFLFGMILLLLGLMIVFGNASSSGCTPPDAQAQEMSRMLASIVPQCR